MYINKISLIFLLSVLAVSCGKELDIEPGVNEVIQPDFSSVEDIETALFGAYSGFKSDRLYTSNILALGEWPADNLKIASQNVGFGAIIHEWDYTESFDTVEDTWVGLYDVIRRAKKSVGKPGNSLITGYSSVKPLEQPVLDTIAQRFHASRHRVLSS